MRKIRKKVRNGSCLQFLISVLMIEATILSCSFVMPRRGCLGWGEMVGERILEDEGVMVRFCTAASKSRSVSVNVGQLAG